jgi:hypothetical protein
MSGTIVPDVPPRSYNISKVKRKAVKKV